MKKLYTMLLGVATATSALAAIPTQQLRLPENLSQKVQEHPQTLKSAQKAELGIRELYRTNRALPGAEKFTSVSMSAPAKSAAQSLKTESLGRMSFASAQPRMRANAMTLGRVAKSQTSTATKAPARAVDNETWVDAGTATYTDGWFVPAYYDPEEYAPMSVQDFCYNLSWEVPVQESATTPGLYKITDPYHQQGFEAFFGPSAYTGILPGSYEIIIDATDTTDVRMDLQPLCDFEAGVIDMEAVTLHGWTLSEFFRANADDYPDITDDMLQYLGYFGTKSGNRITLPTAVFGISDDTTEAAVQWGYYDSNNDWVSFDASTVITLPTGTTGGDDEPEETDYAWTDGGTATFVDTWFMPIFYDDETGVSGQEFCNATSWEVPVMESANYPGIYKLVDPYHQPGLETILGTSASDFITDEANDIIVDATNPNDVRMDLQKLFTINAGLMDATETPFYGWTLGEFYRANPDYGYSDDVLRNAGYFGTISNKFITLPHTTWGNSADKEYASYYWGIDVNSTIALPGAVVMDYSFDVTPATGCLTSDKLTFSVASGADIATVKLFFMPGGWFSASEGNFSIVDGFGSQLITTPETSGTWTLAIDNTEDGPATLFALAYDAAGTRVAGSATTYLIAGDLGHEWKSLGNVDYTEDIMTVYGLEVETYSVELQESQTTPGMFRLVNPYATSGWSFSSNNLHDNSNCNHYLYIDATNPDAVEIPISYVGLEIQPTAHEMVVSYNNVASAPDTSKSGKMADGEITFPANAILETTLGDSSVYLANPNGMFRVALPEGYLPSGVANVATDNASAPVEYFNLQGVRVTAPAAGELVIKRQGGNVSKTIMR